MFARWPWLREIPRLARRAWRRFRRSDVSLLAGALSFFTFLSIAPLAVASATLVAFVLGHAGAKTAVTDVAATLLGPRGSDAVKMLLDELTLRDDGYWYAAIGLVVALFGASRAFAHLHTAVNRIFDVPEREPQSISAKLRLLGRRRLRSIGLVVAVSATIAVSTFAEAVVGGVAVVAGTAVGRPSVALSAAQVLVSASLTIGFLTILYRWLPDAEVGWRDAAVGAGTAGIGIAVTARLTSAYLTSLATRSVSAAAATVVVTLAWLYVTSLLLLLGAAVVTATAHTFGRERVRGDVREGATIASDGGRERWKPQLP